MSKLIKSQRKRATVRPIDLLPRLVFGAFCIQDKAIEIEDKGFYHSIYFAYLMDGLSRVIGLILITCHYRNYLAERMSVFAQVYKSTSQ
jgi:hypothetical protein